MTAGARLVTGLRPSRALLSCSRARAGLPFSLERAPVRFLGAAALTLALVGAMAAIRPVSARAQSSRSNGASQSDSPAHASADIAQAGSGGAATDPPITTSAETGGAASAPTAKKLDTTALASVLTGALRFIQPRTLEPHSLHSFILWGLDGLTALDPAVIVNEQRPDPAPKTSPKPAPAKHIQITLGQNVLTTLDEPAESDLAGWVGVAVSAMQAGWNASASIRSAGEGALLQSFFDEMFNHLDPYSRYIPPTPAVRDRENRFGSTASVGISLTREKHGLVISAVNANGPAWAAGVDNGMTLVAINGHSTRGLSVEKATNWLTGEADTPVGLTVEGKRHRHQTFQMRRAVVPPETVFAYRKDDLEILRITSFSTQTAEELSQYLDLIANTDDLRGLIIDLRDDRGGVLQQAVTAAALVLDHGVAVVTEGRDRQANHVWAVRGGDMTNNLPIVIMVDGRTASAAEILTAALSDHRRAVVIGSATLGKGLVQAIGQMPDGGEIFVTWSRVIAPLGWPLQGLGVMPQLCTSRGGEDVQHQLDALAAGRDLEEPTVRASRAARYPLPVSRILDIRRECPAAIGTDLDLDAAEALLDSPAAYKAALHAIPDDLTAVNR